MENGKRVPKTQNYRRSNDTSIGKSRSAGGATAVNKGGNLLFTIQASASFLMGN